MTDQGHATGPPAGPGRIRGAASASASSFRRAYDVSLETVLDVSTWGTANDLAACHERVRQEVREAVEREDEVRRVLRSDVLPLVDDPNRSGRAKHAGFYRVCPETISVAQRLLFRGATTAVGQTVRTHETLPIGITQLGLCLAGYDGQDPGSYGLRLFRRDVRETIDPAEAVRAILESRQAATDFHPSGGGQDRLSTLARRGLGAFAARRLLCDVAETPWRFGVGPFAPLELLTGSGNRHVLDVGLTLLERWVNGLSAGDPTAGRFAFVLGEGGEALVQTIGDALDPFEFVLLNDDEPRCFRIVERAEAQFGPDVADRVYEFVGRVSKRVTVGVYRVTPHAPPRVFHAHEDSAVEAAVLLMADAALRPYHNRPVLLDLAQLTAEAAFSAEAFEAAVHGGYTASGRPLALG